MAVPDFVYEDYLTAYRTSDATAIITQTQAAIRAYCGWHIAPMVTETIKLDGGGSRHLWLPSLHVVDVATVTNEGTILDVAEDLDWSESGYIELRRGCWTTRPRQIEITYSHGYDNIPEDVVEVVVSVAARAASSPSGALRQATGPFSVEWSKVANGVAGGIALLQHERDILNVYTLPRRA